MYAVLLLCLALIVSVSFLVLWSQKLKIAYPMFLVIAGLLISFIPNLPNTRIDPELVFLILLPPVLFDASQTISWKALWKWRRIIGVMSFGFVLLTSVVVAFVAYLLIPGFSLAQGFLLGAIVSPPDAAATTAVLRYVKLPKGMVSILEGESLLNDAASLTIFRFATAAILTGSFVWYHAAGGLALITCSGILIGVALALLLHLVYRKLHTTPDFDIAISFAFPYLLYIVAETIHSSGVLAVVSGGLFLAYQNHQVISHSSRLRSNAIWSAVVFILNAVVFFLIGLQLPSIISGVDGSFFHAFIIALVIAVVIIVVRMLASLGTSAFTHFISRYITVAQTNPGWRNPLIVGWAGMRGVVSLASALSIPLLLPSGEMFPNRDLILFITFVVILITLVGQGLTLPWVINKVKPEPLSTEIKDHDQLMMIDDRLMHVAATEMQDKYAADIEENILIKNKYEAFQHKADLALHAAQSPKHSSDAKEKLHRYRQVMIHIIKLQRNTLEEFRKKDGFDEDIIRGIEKTLDLEQEKLNEELE